MNLRTTLTLFVFALLAAGCATTSRVPQGAEHENVRDLRPEESTAGAKLLLIARGLVGTPYRFGGDDPRGFDCSGLVVYSFERIGVDVPRTAADQRRAARTVKRAELEPGDLVFFRTSSRRVDHVGIYAGDGRFIHAPSSGRVVSYADLDDPYYLTHFAGAGRF